MMADWDLAFRLIGVGACLLLLVIVLIGEMRTSLRLALSGMVIGAGCYLINASPDIQEPAAIHPIVDLFSIFTPFATWVFARLLFERSTDQSLLIGALLTLLASWIMAHFIPGWSHAGFLLNHIVSLALLTDVVITALSGRADDLIERRRLIRVWLPVLVAIQAGAVLIFELVYGTENPFPALQLLSVSAILVLVLFAGAALLRTDPELLVETVGKSPPRPKADDLSPTEIVLKDKLETAMKDGYYRTEGLTIASLALYLDTPEHRLRALINRRLGYRNFSAFLNGHRIEEAKALLASRERVDLPVLSIAMDLGYNSLPTFNRAFREITGQTPTEFRRKSIDQN